MADRQEKSDTAFRTISEVARDLEVQQHVLRFWESKFSQVRPLKRGGGRRYYRPEDVALLGRIRSLLYEEGYTIRGVQRLLGQSGGPAAAARRPAPALKPTPAPTPAPTPGRRAGDIQPVAGGSIGESELRALLAELKALRALLPDKSS